MKDLLPRQRLSFPKIKRNNCFDKRSVNTLLFLDLFCSICYNIIRSDGYGKKEGI